MVWEVGVGGWLFGGFGEKEGEGLGGGDGDGECGRRGKGELIAYELHPGR